MSSDTNQANHRVQQLQALAETFTTETALFHQAAAAKLGLHVSDVKTLSALTQEGPMTAGQITKRLGLTTGAVTNVIDRLEHKGFVARVPDPHDRRKVVVAPKEQALAVSNSVYAPIGNAFARLLGAYSAEQLDFLVDYHQAVIELTKQQIAQLHASDNTRW